MVREQPSGAARRMERGSGPTSVDGEFLRGAHATGVGGEKRASWATSSARASLETLSGHDVALHPRFSHSCFWRWSDGAGRMVFHANAGLGQKSRAMAAGEARGWRLCSWLVDGRVGLLDFPNDRAEVDDGAPPRRFMMGNTSCARRHMALIDGRCGRPNTPG